MAQQLLRQEPTKAVCYENKRVVADLLDAKAMREVDGAVDQRHCMSVPISRGCRIIERPYSTLWQSLPDPFRPKSPIMRASPCVSKMSTQTVNENDVGLNGCLRNRDWN